ncbi:antibiotic biosynthesis monooxygenase [Microbacterium sp. Sa4CUA7]|uniref:Antibiotic biosynthesis monooxygenase n=1 Tax=Microbacterium pullorum TaxID=2762236 RepID=A0ABR8S047_9MICO|nr:antibiotic biosynthesis monooxygenase family protein [Microbacterium pullorum]MBD7956850.1 antibiotic biosynthesis monooxygenase [Microbacterium pullorum]
MTATPVTVMMDIPLRAGVNDIDAVFLRDLPATRAFPGNRGTEVVAEDSRPDHLVMITRWESRAAYDAYSAWRGTPEGRTHLGEIVAGPPTFRVFHSRLQF